MAPAQLLSRQNLKNGLILEFWDLSRPLVGDRWQVVVEIRVPVAVTLETLPVDLLPQGDRVMAALGPEVAFSKQEERHFITAAAVPALLQEVQEQLSSSLASYLGHPEFAARLIRKLYADHREKAGQRP